MTDLVNEFNISDVEISLSRGMCFGKYPVYSLQILGSGILIYKGEYFVNIIGTVKTQITSEKVFQILKRSLEIGFFSFKDEYMGTDLIKMDTAGNIKHFIVPVTDLPLTIISVKIKDKIKSIRDYQNSPDTLRSFEDYIDDICESHQWTGVNWQSEF